MGNFLMQAFTGAQQQSMSQSAESQTISTDHQMPYLTYLNLVEHIVGLLFQFATIFAIFLLLAIYNFRPQLLRVKTFSLSMLFYLCLHLVCSLLGIPHLIYKVFWWQPLQPGAPSIYLPYLLYWSGLPELSYMALAPLPVFFLILDRCFTLRMANSAQKWSIFLFWASILSAFAVYFGSFAIYLAELPLDLSQIANCELASCQMRKYRNILQLSFKMIFGTANVLFSLLFLYLLNKSGKAKNLKNRVVKYTIMLEILFNVIPGYSAVTFNLISGIPSSAFVGEFALVFCAMDAAICSFIYLKLFLRQKPNSIIPTQIVRGINTSLSTRT